MEGIIYNSKKIKEILSEVSICTQLYCTKDGKIYSSSAEQFLDWINSFTKYCIPEKVNTWKRITHNRIYSPLVIKPGSECTPAVQRLIDNREYIIIDDLYNFMNAGSIMETLDRTHSWDEVDKILKNQGHTGYSFSGVSNVMLQFSPYGVEFVDRYDSNRINRSEEFKELYIEASNLNEERKQANERLVNVISRKLILERTKL